MPSFPTIWRALAAIAFGLIVASPDAAWADRFAVVGRSTDQGLVQSQVRALLQDSQGFIWVGTHAGGLDRFDGLTFEHHTVRQGLPSNLVLDIAEHGGTLYAATRLGLARLRGDGRFEEIPLPEGFDDPQINALEEDEDGRLWVGSYSGLFRMEGDELVFVTQLGSVVRALASDGHGGLWAASDAGLHHAPRHGPWETLPRSEALEWVGRILPAADGSVWLGTKRGLFRYDGDRIAAIPLEAHPPQSRVYALYADGDGAIWVGTARGLVRINSDGAQQVFGPTEGLPDAPIIDIIRDREGTLHLGTNGAGLASLPQVPFYTWTSGPLQSYAPTRPVWVDHPHNTTLWIPTLGQGLWRKRGDALIRVGPERGVPDSDIAFVLPKDGRLWVGMARGLVTSNDGEHFQQAPDLPPDLKDAPFIDGLVDGEGSLWFATGKGLASFNGQTWQLYGPDSGFPAQEPLTLRAADGPNIWVGTQASGAILWDTREQQVVQHLRGGGELPSDSVTAILKAGDGTWWMGTDHGIALLTEDSGRIIGWDEGLPEGYLYFLCNDTASGGMWVGTSRGVARWEEGRFTVYGRSHGLPAEEANSGACNADPEGRLWLGTVDGYAIYDPRTKVDIPPPDTLLVEATVGEAPLPIRGLVELDYQQNELQWRFISPTFVDPDGLYYETRLTGYRDQWVRTKQRSAHYAALSPGRYTFAVRGCTAQGCDPFPATSAVLIIHPPWYTRTWARLLFVIAVFLCGVSVALVRSRRLQRRAEELERQVAVRTFELAEEKEKSDTLLLNTLPRQVVDELKEHGEARPKRYPDVTILFTDLQGFTKTASTVGAEELVEELNELFAAFDAIAQGHGLEKLKTIGDAYMAVGGLPVPNTTHPEDAVAAGLKMQAYMEERRQMPGALPFNLRVGVHTGEVVAGVIGAWKYAYDIWGDAVNIASRMESGGEPGKVNISKATFERVRHLYRCTYRGKRAVKGKGALDMYFAEAPMQQAAKQDAERTETPGGTAA